MNFKEFIKLCQSETNLYYFFNLDSGLYIRDKIKDTSFLNEPSAIILNFQSGSLTLKEESCSIQSAPYPNDGFETECYFCYYIESGATLNAVKRYSGFIYKPKDENHYDFLNNAKIDFHPSREIHYRMGQE